DKLADNAARRRLVRNDAIGHAVNDLEIDLRIRAVNLTAPQDPLLMQRLLLAADLLLERYQKRTGHVSDIERAVTLVDRVGSAISETHGLFSDHLLIYGRAHLAVFEATQNSIELDKAITELEAYQRVVGGHPELLQLHGNLLLQRFRNVGDEQDLRTGIDRARAVQTLQGVETDTQIYALSNLSESLPFLLDFGAEDGDAHLDNAVEMGLRAKELAQREDCGISDISFVYGALALAQYYRYQPRREPTDLEDSLANGKTAVDLVTERSPDKVRWLNNLGLAHVAEFRISAKDSSLDEAARLFEEAVTLSLEGSKSRLISLSNLADALGLRFEWTGEMEALDIAVSRYRTLASLENTNATEWAVSLQNLGNILLHAYGCHLRGELLDEAVEALERALAKYPKGHTESVVTHSLLCNALAIRSWQPNRKPEILLAIDHGEKAALLAGPDHPHGAHLRHILSQAYLNKWDAGGCQDDQDLVKAFDHSEQCLRLAPPDAQDRALYLLCHGNLLAAQILGKDPEIGRIAVPPAFAEPLRNYKEAVESPNGLPLLRIRAARKAIRILGGLDRWEEAVPVGREAMRLLSLACGRYLSLQDQQQVISETSGLASEICSLMLQVGKAEEALQQLEAGRAMLLGFAMEKSDEATALKATDKDLAKELEDIKAKLRISPDLQGRRLGEIKLRERRAAEVDLKNCLDKIRSLPGHQDFLLEPPLDHMKSCSKDGAVVLVNISYMRSDAIILVDEGIRVVPLSKLQLEKAVDFGVKLIAGFSTVDFPVKRAYEVLSRKVPKQPSRQDASSDFLSWLWDSCVQPIFNELRKCGAVKTADDKLPLDPLPRIWWIGSGLAAGFPFHAAAASESGQDALCLSVSSYAPSIKALLHARQRSAQSQALRSASHQTRLHMTVITMETTPGGHAPLPGVKEEKEVVMDLAKALAKEKLKCTDLPQPNVACALEAIAKSDIVHFACHGEADRRDPSQSHLVLEKPCAEDKTSKEVDKLTVSHFLAQDNLQKVWIAFLSACTTASMGSFRLGDEGLHTSGALQIAGFSHVIGSLWKVEDEVGVHIARVFYTSLFGVEKDALDDRVVAVALREAVMKTRERYPSSWTKWAAYIHSGA
ncbi:hypothetical protein M406DRAFT_225980, partial [Cryphonectria parasitica EP155]